MNWRIWRRPEHQDLEDEIAYDLAAEAEEQDAARHVSHGSRADRVAEISAMCCSIRETAGNVGVELSRPLRTGSPLCGAGSSPATRDSLLFGVVLALGIGADAAIFTLINAVMFDLPVAHPEELVQVTGMPNLNPERWSLIRDRRDIFSGVFVHGVTGGGDLSGGGEARPVAVAFVTGDFFSTLGVEALGGRTLRDADDYRGCPLVAVITYAFWQSEYGGRRDIIGTNLTINALPVQIVGVTGPAFFGIEIGDSIPIIMPQCAAQAIRPGVGMGSVIGTAAAGRNTGPSTTALVGPVARNSRRHDSRRAVRQGGGARPERRARRSAVRGWRAVSGDAIRLRFDVADGRDRRGVVDRVREHREPVVGASHRPAARDRGSTVARRKPAPAHSAVIDREASSYRCLARWLGCFLRLGKPSPRQPDDQTGTYTPRSLAGLGRAGILRSAPAC